MNKLILATLCLLTALPVLSPPARAEDEDSPEIQTYDPTYTGMTNEAADQIRALKKQSQVNKGFIKPTTVQVSITHPDYMNDDQFALMMAVPDMVSGCFKFTPLEYEANFIDPYFLDIKVKRYRRIAPEGVNAQAACSNQNKMSTALMPLSKKELMKRGTQEIRFSTEVATDIYKVILDDKRLQLVPQSMVVFKPQVLSGPLRDRITYAFTGKKMVILQVPMAQPGEDLTPQILAFARTRALTPSDPEQPASWEGNGLATYSFYDQTGHVTDKIEERGYANIGTITVDRPYDGPEGRTTRPVNLSVFVTHPGTQL